MRRLGWLFVMVVLALTLAGPAIGQPEYPDKVQIHGLIRVIDDRDATKMHWIEVWESWDATQKTWQLVVVDAQAGGVDGGVKTECYYAMSQGDGVFHYVADGERIPVNSARAFRARLEKLNIIRQSFDHATGSCPAGEEDAIINDLRARKCVFENEDASGLFLVTAPATSHGTLWRAAEGPDAGFPLRYHFEADGSENEVMYHYEAYLRDFEITPPEDIHLLCFEEGFPANEEMEPTAANDLTYAAYTTTWGVEELKMYFDAALAPDWERQPGGKPELCRYKRTLESGTECSLALRFKPQGAGTDVVVQVYPTSVDLESVPVVEMPSTVVSNFVDVGWSVPGSVEEALDEVLPDQFAQGWVERPELTDVRESSAFVTLAGEDGEEMHILVEHTEGISRVRLLTRQRACGPVFETR